MGTNTLMILKVTLGLLVIAHYNGCMWHGVAVSHRHAIQGTRCNG